MRNIKSGGWMVWSWLRSEKVYGYKMEAGVPPPTHTHIDTLQIGVQ